MINGISSALHYLNDEMKATKMLQELIEMGEKLCSTLEKASLSERKFCLDVQIEFERMMWDSIRMTNDLRNFKEKFGE